MSDTESSVGSQSDLEESENDPQFDRQDMLRAVRETHLDALERSFANINDVAILNEYTAVELRVLREQMQVHFTRMEEAHIQYRQCCLMASNQVYEDTEARLHHALALIDTRLMGLNSQTQTSVRPQPQASARPQMQTRGQSQPEVGDHPQSQSRNHSTPMAPSRRLTFGPYETPGTSNSMTNADGQPRIQVEMARRPQIGTFNGDTSEWPQFRDLFIAEVHNRNYEPVTKLHYLREACKGKAADTLGPWQPTAANYQLAWETMMDAYDDEYHIVHGLLAKLHSTPKQEIEDHEALRSVLDSLNSCIRQLNSQVESAPVLLDQIWIHHGKQRLPSSTLDAWEQYRNQRLSATLPTLKEFKLFLESKSKARRESEHVNALVPHHKPTSVKREDKDRRSQANSSGSRYKPYDRTRVEGKRAAGDSFGYGPPKQCIMTGCDQTHYLGQCQQFSKLSLAERMTIVREHRLCRCCLLAGHMSSSCRRTGCSKCPEDKLKHHFRLCSKPMQAKQDPSSDHKPQSK